jgi:CHASE1-domain containing sensor protein
MSVGYYKDLVPFYTTAQLKQPSFSTILFGTTVTNSSRAAFEAMVRSWGGTFTNYYINARDASNIAYPANAAVYYPYYMVLPESLQTINNGFDAGSDEVRRAALFKSLAIGDIASSSVTLLTGQNVSGIVTYRWFPSTTYYSNVVFRLDVLLAQGLSETTLNNYYVQFYDLTSSTNDFWYSTIKSSQNPYPSTPVSNLTAAQHRSMMANAPLSAITNITVANRVIQAVFIPVSTQSQQYQKWLGLSLSLAAGFALCILTVIFIRQLHASKLRQEVDHRRIHVLEESSRKVTAVMERLDEQDSRARATLDAIPDMICVIDNTGKILTTNTAFDRDLSYTEIKNMSIQQVLPELPSNYHSMKDYESVALTSFKSVVPVSISVREFDIIEDSEAGEDTWANVVVIRNLSDREKLIENVQRQKTQLKSHLKMAEFNAMFAHNTFRRDLLQCSEKIHNSEGVRFLIDVHKYKKSKVSQRADRQQEIYAKYLKIGSPYQLNISSELSEQMAQRVKQSLGDTVLFNDVEEMVRGMVLLEVYPKYNNRHNV